MRAVLFLLACAAPALAAGPDTPLTAGEFDALVTGKTLTYQQQDMPFGVEEYLPDRRVRWSVSPDHCQYGIWYPQARDICFLYEDSPDPACWTFWLDGGVLHARSASTGPGADLHVTDISSQPLSCPGPDVGV